MLLPTSGPVQWHEHHPDVFPDAFAEIGIDLQQDWVSWATLGPRATNREVGQYSEGGYDICYFGMSLGTPFDHPISSLKAIFGKESIPPYGFNVMYWSDLNESYMTFRANEQNLLLEDISNEFNITNTKKLVEDWVKIWYDVLPNILISTQVEVHAIGAGLYGYDPVNPYPLLSMEDMWTTADYLGGDQVVLAASTGGQVFNPMIATDVYDQYMSTLAFDGLYGRTPSKEIVLPTGTNRDTWMLDHYGTKDNLAFYPRIATKMGNYSADGLSYQVDMRDDVYFHDGHQADMWDLAMSFQAQLTPKVAAITYTNLLVPFGMDNKTAKHGNYSFTVSDANGDGHYERINITLATTFAPFEGVYIGQFFYPEHILGDPVTHGFDSNGNFDPENLWQVKPDDWGSHSTCTGRTSDPGGYPGPISIGPFIFKEFDATTGFVSLEKFNQTRWDNATGQWVNDPNVSFWNIDALDKVPNTGKIIIAMMDSALADLKTGGVNVMDPQFTMANILDELQAEPTIQAVLSPESGWQAIWLNPKFTTNNGECPFNQKGVRHAISHIIPRKAIIDIRGGLFQPSFSPFPVNSWYVIDPDDLLNYKKLVQAKDDTFPETWETTAYDSFNVTTARAWMASEGYNFSTLKNFSTMVTDTTGKPNQFFSPPYVDPRLVILALVITSLVVVHHKGKKRK